jgi:DNA repair protein RecO (recombination protein O)
LDQTEAIVLRMHPWSETSLIGSLYTREFGKISVVAKGARRPKSPFEAALDLLSVCRVVFIPKSGDVLNLLTEAKLVRRFRNVDRSLLRLYSAYYVAEMLDQFTDQGGSQTEIYELARETLLQLDQTQLEVRAIVLRFEMQMLRLSGLMPSLRLCAGCGNAIDAQQWLIYGAYSGGVLCSACSQGGRQLIRIPLEVRDFVEAFGNRDWRSVPVDHYIVRWRSTVRAMMAKTIAGLLEHRLKLHPYLEELGR